MRVSLLARLAAATVAASFMVPSAAWAFIYVLLPTMQAPALVPITDAYDPPLRLPGIRGQGSAPGDPIRRLLGHPGVTQCLADGGAVLVQTQGAVGCWTKQAIKVHRRVPSGDWPMIAPDSRSADAAFAKCLKRDAISLTVVRNVLVCVDTPDEVIGQSVNARRG